MISCASKRHRVAEQEPICRVTGLARQEYPDCQHYQAWAGLQQLRAIEWCQWFVAFTPSRQAEVGS
jgi:hypothetical protein